MKPISLVLFFSLLNGTTVFAATLSITVIAPKKQDIKITEPLNGAYFWGNFTSYSLNADNKLSLPNRLTRAGIIDIAYGPSSFRFYIEPGKDYSISIDLSDSRQPFRFSGAGADGQYQLNKFKPSALRNQTDSWIDSDSSLTTITRAIEREKDRSIRPFDSLLSAGKISRAFYGLAASELTYYYAEATASVMMNAYRQNKSDWQGKVHFMMSKAELDKSWSGMYDTYKLSGTYALGSRKFFAFADNFIGAYQLQFLGDALYHRGAYWTMKPYTHTARYNAYTKHFKGEAREYLLFQYLHQAASQRKYEQELVTLYDRYKATYPKSIYLPFLKPEIDKVLAFHIKARMKADSTQVFLTNYAKINSLAELMARFKGKVVFVDMWATWCAPCKEEFQYNPELKRFLKEKNVEMLYISMDDADRDQQWKDMIKYYDLSGTHIRVSDSLRKDLSEKIWNSKTGDGYSIPQYLIFRDGTMVEHNAKRPGSRQELYDQIAAYL
ncbi:TlpA family protein disulfide reductase [Hufsiella ginkgonis]|uniref:Redoxin family protein n=1 Tax=Hufsiella ginkgonis TaxID=2695274 RepID=A0A7K1XW51_9SPHI|nr:TlpA disulfide reductase family protein [Hufsiella ginkgonis]MXV15038.1 redoxin family protein [Hufsiella ginkgonis]